MTMEFRKIEANDFLTFIPGTPAHVEIETVLIEIGGGGKNGIQYKQEVMAKAGWKYKELTSYGAHAETAATAFNRIAEALKNTQDKDQLLNSF